MNNSLIKNFLQNHFLVVFILIILGWFLLQVKHVILYLFISYIIMSALSPFVITLKKWKMPHVLSVIIPYFLTILFMSLIIFALFPFFNSQIQDLFQKFPTYINQVLNMVGVSFDSSQIREFLASEIGTIGRNAFSVTSRVFGGFFSILMILVVSFYLLLDENRIKEGVVSLFSTKSQPKVKHIFAQAEEKVGAWLRGQLILSLSISFFTYLTLTFLGLEFALPLALIAGILEIVPTIGPIISAIPAILVALTVSFNLALVVALVYILIQFLENHILVPSIMHKAVGLHPIIIILGVVIGGELFGILGALLAVPFISFIVVIYKNIKS